MVLIKTFAPAIVCSDFLTDFFNFSIVSSEISFVFDSFSSSTFGASFIFPA